MGRRSADALPPSNSADIVDSSFGVVAGARSAGTTLVTSCTGFVTDAFATDGKTKSVATAVKALGGGKTLIVDAKTNGMLVRGAKNLASSQWLAPEGLNVYDILRHEALIISRASVEQVQTALKPGKATE